MANYRTESNKQQRLEIWFLPNTTRSLADQLISHFNIASAFSPWTRKSHLSRSSRIVAWTKTNFHRMLSAPSLPNHQSEESSARSAFAHTPHLGFLARRSLKSSIGPRQAQTNRSCGQARILRFVNAVVKISRGCKSPNHTVWSTISLFRWMARYLGEAVDVTTKGGVGAPILAGHVTQASSVHNTALSRTLGL